MFVENFFVGRVYVVDVNVKVCICEVVKVVVEQYIWCNQVLVLCVCNYVDLIIVCQINQLSSVLCNFNIEGFLLCIVVFIGSNNIYGVKAWVDIGIVGIVYCIGYWK